jgi:hypothetical protein
MTRHVISHRKPRRKRGGARGFVLRRFGMLTVTVAALGAASWIAPYIYRAVPPPPVEVAELPSLPPKRPPPAEVIKTIAYAGEAPLIQAQRPRRSARRGIPLDARPGATGEDFEILTAAELEAISQARN